MIRKHRGGSWIVGLVVVVLAAMLAGCGAGESTEVESGGDASSGYTSAVLETSYEGALNVQNQLIFGTLRLEETEDTVTPEQAGKLLPLWQSLQGGVTAEAEVNAVMKQIEGTMT
ncbi:MAG: hypothetical protein MUQ10_04960, partial [Anaerolineae bacterium]|nr:hypothetical protein [Anaerolineae bacterium]